MTTATTRGNSTAVYVAKMQRVIEQLHFREMSAKDVAAVLGYGVSGSKKYLRTLMLGEIVEIVSISKSGQQTFRLIADDAQIAKFTASLSSQRGPKPGNNEIRNGAALRDPTRHFHVMMDDASFVIKTLRKIPAHTELHAAFFRQPGAEV